MGIELFIVEELASISVTLTELTSITSIINREIRKNDFAQLFNKMIRELAMSYDVVTENLAPFAGIDSESSFIADYDGLHAAYSACYLKEVSKPRLYADNAYEDYLVLKTFKESKTSFPLLKRTFTRLDQFVDKWVTNDAWLAMNIDNLFKRLQQLLNEIAEMKKKDPADAWLIHHAAFCDFSAYLALISDKRAALEITS